MQNKCHFCNRSAKHPDDCFSYSSLGGYNYMSKKLSVCAYHFDLLCDYSYTRQSSDHIPIRQLEYLAILRLEKELNISNTISRK